MYSMREALMALSFLKSSGRCLMMGGIDAEGAYTRIPRIWRGASLGEYKVQVRYRLKPQGCLYKLQPMAGKSMEIYDWRAEDLIGYLLCSFIGRDACGQSALCMNGELR